MFHVSSLPRVQCFMQIAMKCSMQTVVQCIPLAAPCMCLLPAVCPALFTGAGPQDSVSEQSERFFVAEIVREQIFLQYHQEIPYCTAVITRGPLDLFVDASPHTTTETSLHLIVIHFL